MSSALTFKAKHSKESEFFVAVESSERVFTETGAVQVSHRGLAAGRYMTPIDGSANTGRSQIIIGDARIRGVNRPAVRFTVPFRYDSMERLGHVIFGTAYSAGGWAIADNPSSFSVGVNDGVKYHKFSGGYCATFRITFNQESVAELEVTMAFEAYADPVSNSSYPALTPDHTEVPYTILNATLSHKSSAPVDTSGIPFKRCEIVGDWGLQPEHYDDFDPLITTGILRVTGNLDYRVSAGFYTEWLSLLPGDAGAGYSTEYVKVTLASTPGSKAVTFVMPARFNLQEFVAPVEGLLDSNLEFGAGADDGSFTNVTCAATATTY